jgi:hypothetical protein
LLIFFRKRWECCYRIFPFYFYLSHQIIESELSMSSMPCASRTTSVNFCLSHYLSSSPGEKSACTRPDQILWSSLEVERSRSFSRYFSFPWLQLKLIEVAVQNWNSANLMMTKVWVKVVTFYCQKFDKIPSLRAMFSILLHLPSLHTHILQTLILFFSSPPEFFTKKNLKLCKKNLLCKFDHFFFFF